MVISRLGDLNYRVRLSGSRKAIGVQHNRLQPAPREPSDPRLVRAPTDDVGGEAGPLNDAERSGGAESVASSGMCGRFGMCCSHPARKPEYAIVDVEGYGGVTAVFPSWQTRVAGGELDESPVESVGPAVDPDALPVSLAAPPELAAPSTTSELAVHPERTAAELTAELFERPAEQGGTLTDLEAPGASAATDDAAGGVRARVRVEHETPILPRRSGRKRGPPDRLVPCLV